MAIKKKYTPEIISFLRDKAKGRSNKELAAMVNARFSLSFTKQQIKSAKCLYGIRSGRTDKLSPEQADFLKKNVTGKPFKVLTALFNEHFKTNFTFTQIRCFCKSKGIKRGMIKYPPELKNYIKENYRKAANVKGMVAMANKHFGIRLSRRQIYYIAQSLDIRMKKYDPKPVNYERVDSRGYLKVMVKANDGRKWGGKHELVWEAANGPVPKGHVVIFLDNNKLNCEIENLAIVSNRERFLLSRSGLRSANREETLAGIAVVKHTILIHDRLKELLGGAKEYQRYMSIKSTERKREQKRAARRWT